MGLLRQDSPEQAPKAIYGVRMKIAGAGDEAWVEDKDGRRALAVDAKALRTRRDAVIRDTAGRERARILSRPLGSKDQIVIHDDGGATVVRRSPVGISRFAIDADDGALDVQGNVLDREYELVRGDQVVASVSKSWFRARDVVGVAVHDGVRDATAVALVIAMELLED